MTYCASRSAHGADRDFVACCIVCCELFSCGAGPTMSLSPFDSLGARRNGFDAACSATAAHRIFAADFDVAEVAAVACGAVDEAVIENESSADTCRDDHSHEVFHSAGGTNPVLSERDAVAVAAERNSEAGEFFLAESTNAVVAPRGQIQRGDFAAGN